MNYIPSGSFEEHLNSQQKRNLGNGRGAICCSKLLSIPCVYLLTTCTHKPTTIHSFFLSLSNVLTFAMENTAHYRKQIQSSLTSNYVILQEIILTVCLSWTIHSQLLLLSLFHCLGHEDDAITLLQSLYHLLHHLQREKLGTERERERKKEKENTTTRTRNAA